MFTTSVAPRSEQIGTVRFLDHMGRRIRRYIRAKQNLIKLLKVQKVQKQEVYADEANNNCDPSPKEAQT